MEGCSGQDKQMGQTVQCTLYMDKVDERTLWGRINGWDGLYMKGRSGAR
jgi:hypothetical protein